MTITPEEAIKWHEQRAAEAHAGLSCGSENSEYRAADKVAEMHRMAARAISAVAAMPKQDGDLPQSPWPASDWAADRIEAIKRENAELREKVKILEGHLDAAIEDFNEARNAALEEAAKVASPNHGPGIFDQYENGRRDAAAAIRSLASKEG